MYGFLSLAKGFALWIYDKINVIHDIDKTKRLRVHYFELLISSYRPHIDSILSLSKEFK